MTFEEENGVKSLLAYWDSVFDAVDEIERNNGWIPLAMSPKKRKKRGRKS